MDYSKMTLKERCAEVNKHLAEIEKIFKSVSEQSGFYANCGEDGDWEELEIYSASVDTFDNGKELIPAIVVDMLF